MRHSSLRFRVIADEVLLYSEKHHRDRRTLEGRLKRILSDFGERAADQIKPADIDAWLADNTKTPATANRYRAVFSLVFREALRNGKVTSNPVRLVRMRHEDNGRIRFLTDEEEAELRAVILKRFPEHLPELVISLGTGMRLSELYTLIWKNVDFARRESVGASSQTSNRSSLFLTLPTRLLAFQAFIRSAGKGRSRAKIRRICRCPPPPQSVCKLKLLWRLASPPL